MTNNKKIMVTLTAAVAAAVMALAGCGSSGTASDSGTSGAKSSGTFLAAGLFPLTGSFAYVGPASSTSLELAKQEINAAGGVLGKDMETTTADSSDADHADQNTSSAQSLISKNPSVIIGPAVQRRGQEHVQAGHHLQHSDDFRRCHLHLAVRP